MAVLTYFIVYIPDMLGGRSFMGVLNLQDSMYIYQSTLKATHPFQSPFFSWPLLFNPFTSGLGGRVALWLQYASGLPNGDVSTIVALGNPALWWLGFAVILALTVYYVPKFVVSRKVDLKKNLPVVFILVYFFFQWLPYIIITRVVFIYHFYSNVPFLCLGVAFVVNRYWSNNYVKAAALAYFAMTVALFILFYPVISGVPTSSSIIHNLEWFKGWQFG